MMLMIYHTGSIHYLSSFTAKVLWNKGLSSKPEEVCLRRSADVSALRHQEARCKQTNSFTLITVSAVCVLVVDAD